MLVLFVPPVREGGGGEAGGMVVEVEKTHNGGQRGATKVCLLEQRAI